MNRKSKILVTLILIIIISTGLALTYWTSLINSPTDEDSDGSVANIGRWVEFEVWKTDNYFNFQLNSGETLTVIHRIGTLTSSGTNISTTVYNWNEVTTINLYNVAAFEITFRTNLSNTAVRMRSLIDSYFENSESWHVSTSQSSLNSEVRLGFRNPNFQFHFRLQINNQPASGNPGIVVHNLAWQVNPIPTQLNPANHLWIRNLSWSQFNNNPSLVPGLIHGINSNSNAGQIAARQYVIPLSWTYEVVNQQNANVDIRISGNNRVITVWAFAIGDLPIGWWDNLPT